jgi:FkbM family methyltransferase
VPVASPRRLLKHPRVEPFVATVLRSLRVRDRVRFVAAEHLHRGHVHRHRLRATGLEVLLEHGSPDIESFDELFCQEIYAPPPEVGAAVAALGRPPRILDVGANIGLFGTWALGRWPDATIDAYEPDPRNAAKHRRLIERSGRAGRWRLHQAAAAAADGTLAFAAGNYAMSGPAAPGDPGAIEVAAVDVLPALAACDLLKLDAEGSEWAILGDPRFGETTAVAVALEFHPELAPGPDARAEAFALLEGAGFAVRDAPTRAPAGYGSVWAWRAPASRST